MSTSIRSTDRFAGELVAAPPLLAALFLATLGGWLGGDPAAAAAARSVHDYRPPDVVLVDSSGREVRLEAVLDGERPVLLQFVFTTCPAVCPVLTATMRSVHDRLQEASIDARIVSISIDPEHDTPQRLRAHAESFGAGEGWHFLTGGVDEIERVQKAFDAYRDDKMSHAPLTFLRPASGTSWVRFAGYVRAEQIVGELVSPGSAAGRSSAASVSSP